MAVNKPVGDGHRIGAVKHREQVFNPKTKQWVKINTGTNLFMDVNQNGKPFKGVTKK